MYPAGATRGQLQSLTAAVAHLSFTYVCSVPCLTCIACKVQDTVEVDVGVVFIVMLNPSTGLTSIVGRV